MNSRRLILGGGRLLLVLFALLLMVPLSFFGFGLGGELGGSAAAAAFGPRARLLGMIAGAMLFGGASLAIPVVLARWLEKRLERALPVAR